MPFGLTIICDSSENTNQVTIAIDEYRREDIAEQGWQARFAELHRPHNEVYEREERKPSRWCALESPLLKFGDVPSGQAMHGEDD